MNWNNLVTQARENPALVAVAGSAVAVLVLAVLAAVVVRKLRGKTLNAKKTAGFGVVQAGVSYIVITGVFEFFRGVLGMPVVEAAILAVFIEAATWGGVGFIYAHGKTMVTGPDGTERPSTGFGDAGPFFWFAVLGGGTLAILGSKGAPVAIGRCVIVALGAYMWYLQLLQVTRRSGKRSRWRWTPKRLLLLVGAIEPAEEDVRDEAREWQIRHLARAIRWANSWWPWSWLGSRSLVKRAETTTEDVLAEARRRWAAAYVLKSQVGPESAVMKAVIGDVERAQLGSAGRDTDGAEVPRESVKVPAQVTRGQADQWPVGAPTNGRHPALGGGVPMGALPPAPAPAPAPAEDAPADGASTGAAAPAVVDDRSAEARLDPPVPAPVASAPVPAPHRSTPPAGSVPTAPIRGAAVPKVAPTPAPSAAPATASLRSRVFTLLDEQVPVGDTRDNATLIDMVATTLQLAAGDRASAAAYVRAWRRDVESGRRTPTAGRRLRSVPSDQP